MFKFEELERMHVEITNRCQASCPMCPRNIHSGIDNPLINETDWTLQDFTTVVNLDVLKHLKQIIFCGSFGDPFLNNDLIAMCRYLRHHSPELQVQIHTNGSGRKPAWWAELAKALPNNHRVIFALDGLEDTHALYRVGTDWHKVIESAKAFMAAGGKATWHFVRFKHNEHQVAACEQMAKDLGFETFTLRNTRRFSSADFKSYNRDGELTHVLEQPSDDLIGFVDFKTLTEYLDTKKTNDIFCYAEATKEVYIDAQFTMFPCCVIPAFLYTNYDASIPIGRNLDPTTYSMYGVGKKIQENIYSMIDELGGLDSLNTKKLSIKSIMETAGWKTLITKKWQDNSATVCTAMCSTDSPYIKIKDQKQAQIALK